MIVMRIFGGLGNQMFQYAAGRALADRLGVELLLDLREFETYRLHAYGLDSLRVRARHASVSDLRPWPEQRRRFARLVTKVGLSSARDLYIEPAFTYDERWPHLGDGTHLNGYFQSERYFGQSRDRLREELIPVEPLAGENAKIASMASECESVAIHVRRGDYVSNAKTLSLHGVCSPAYYQRAIASLRERRRDVRFFVFSNDMDWSRENLHLGEDAVFVEGNEQAPQVDIHLMSKCRHHVIANSSFSWWGAWLGRHQDQCVIAPTPWFDSPKLCDRDLLPERWVRLDKH